MNGLNRTRRARVAKARRERLAGATEKQTGLFARAVSGWLTLASFVVNTAGALIFLLFGYLLVQAVVSESVEVAPISVPKSLAELGYTSEAVTGKLRAALLTIQNDAKTVKRTADVLNEGDVPKIALPETGLSIDLIASQIRSRLGIGIGKNWKISGSVECKDTDLVANISLDSEAEHKLIHMIKPKSEVDELFIAIAHNIYTEIDEYIEASWWADRNADKAYELAEHIIRTRSSGDPAVFWAHLLLSYIYGNKMDFIHGASEAKTAIDIDAKSALAYYDYGVALKKLNHPDSEVIDKYKIAISFNSRFAPPHINLGLIYVDRDQLDHAIDEYNKAIAIDARDPVAHNNLGIAFAEQGNSDAAIDEYSRAITLDPRYARAHNNLGVALRSKGKPSLAIEEYRIAIAIDPRYARAHNNLGDALRSIGDLAPAIDEYDEAVSFEPDNRNYLKDQKEALAERDRQEAIAAQASNDPPPTPLEPP